MHVKWLNLVRRRAINTRRSNQHVPGFQELYFLEEPYVFLEPFDLEESYVFLELYFPNELYVPQFALEDCSGPIVTIASMMMTEVTTSWTSRS